MASGQGSAVRNTASRNTASNRDFGISRAWEGLTVCIGVPCGISSVNALRLASSISVTCAIMSFSMGVWLTVLVILNGSLPYHDQMYFEKIQTLQSGTHDYFVNEASYVLTPIKNLNFYLLSISTIAILSGMGRFLASVCVSVTYLRKRVLSGLVSWAWVILSMFSVVTLGIVSADTLYTLMHNDLVPPYDRDFYFLNDTYGFYMFCHYMMRFVIFDFVVTCYLQWVIRWFHRSSTARRAELDAGNRVENAS